MALCFAPKERLTVSQWSEKHRVHAKESNAAGGGRWRNLPMQVQPMDDATDPEVSDVVLMWAAQTAGKTEIIMNVSGYFMEHYPSPQLMVQPTLDLAKDYSNDRIDPMIRESEVLNTLFDEYGNITELHKSFPGGYCKYAGANSPSSLASRPVRVTLFDEIDRYPKSAGKEGDPFKLAQKRSDTFPDAVSYQTSTPTIRKHSRIETRFEMSDQNYWYAKCPCCGTEQIMKWKQVKWPHRSRISEAYYECEASECQAHWDDEKREKAIKAGRWVPHNKFTGIRGYHLSGMYTLFKKKRSFKSRMHQWASEFYEAKKEGKESMKVWTNTFLAETWSDEGDVKPEWSNLFDRRETYLSGGFIPQEVQLISVGTDFQHDRIELEFVGWADGEESWGLRHSILYGDPRNKEIYARLEAELQRTFTRMDGARLQVNCAGFDTGFAGCQRQLYAWLKPRLGRRFYAFKGSNNKYSEPISSSSKNPTDKKIKLIMVGTNRIKTYIYNRVTILATGPGCTHIPEEYTAEWCKQLLSEDFETVTQNGTQYRIYTMPTFTPQGGTDRNEALDMRVYATGALYARGIPNWRILEKRNLATIPADPGRLPAANDPQPVPNKNEPNIIKKGIRRIRRHGRASILRGI